MERRRRRKLGQELFARGNYEESKVRPAARCVLHPS